MLEENERPPPRSARADAAAQAMLSFFELAPDLCCVSDETGALQRVNAAFDVLGYEREELTAKSVVDLVHPDDKKGALGVIEALARSKAPPPSVQIENRLLCKDGSYRWLAWTCCRTPSGAIVSIGRDITHARRAVEEEFRLLQVELERQRHQYQAIFDTLPQMIWLKDTDNVIIRANAAAAGSIGLTPPDVEGHSTWELYPELAAKYHDDDLAVVREGRPMLDIVEPYEQDNGETRWVRTDKTPYRENDRIVGVVVSATDVTGWKRGEQERARLYEQLKHVDALKTQFFANVSHELRTPLSLVLGPIERLLDAKDLGADRRRELEVVRRNARILLKRVNDLLEIAKMDAGKVVLALAPVDFDAVVRATAAQFESIARDRDISIAIESEGPLVGRGDAEKLQRVVGNIFANAFRFTPDGGIVRCTVRACPRSEGQETTEEVTIEIADSGIGIEASMREAIFERFRQGAAAAAAPAAARRDGGTGLGLAIAKELVSLHRGTIAASVAPEGGALFTVRIPRSAPMDPSEDLPRDERPSSPPTVDAVEELHLESDASKTRAEASPSVIAPARDDVVVLVVEDNPEMNRFVSQVLSADYRVVGAYDGDEGLRVAQAVNPDLVISDVMMPGRDGLSFLRALRADPALSTVPVVLLTARADEETLVSALTEGADDYLTKPFSSRELVARVHAHLQLARMRREVARREEEASQLRLAVKARDEFLSVASHELRTPLSTLQLNLQVMERLPPHAVQLRSERLAVATRACKQMSSLINTLLDVARVATGHMDLDRCELDLRELIQDLARRFEGEVSASGSTLELHMGGPAVGCWDRLRLEQVLSNLIGNAIKFGTGKPIELGYTVDPECVHVTVQDHGVGIAPEDQKRIFQRFEQAVASRSYGGLGLGLWIANDIVCRHDGVIHLESKPGAGSTFTIDLPRAARGPS